MATCIPLIGQMSDVEAERWIKHLSVRMPSEVIVPFNEMSSEQRKQCDVAIVANPKPYEISQCPNLVWLQSLWAGVEKLVLALPNQNLKVVRLIDPGLTETMAEAALAWSLYLHRDMPFYRQQQNDKRWKPQVYIPARDRTIGILGLGELGRASALRLVENDFNVIGWSRSIKDIDGVTTYQDDAGLKQVLNQSDIIICLLPLSPQTNHLLNEEALAHCRVKASLINFARGAIIDDVSLINALNSGKLSHAVLDVFNKEPLPSDHPYWSMPTVTVLPHISAQTPPESASNVVAQNITNYRLKGTLPKAVDLLRGY